MGLRFSPPEDTRSGRPVAFESKAQVLEVGEVVGRGARRLRGVVRGREIERLADALDEGGGREGLL